jgi:hypothetical protein
MNHKKGQILFMFVFSVMVIIGFMTLLVNISKVSIARLKLQKAADASALTLATYQARALNAVADKNFILKYPSGDKKKVYIKNSDTGYSFPGIHQVDVSEGFEFSFKSDYENFLNITTPHIEQQNMFINIYEKLLPKIVEEYTSKNDKDATIYDKAISPFTFKRENVRVKYREWEKSVGKNVEYRKDIDAWMVDTGNYLYSLIKLRKNYEIWDTNFNMEAVGLGEVVRDVGELWEEPKPEYMAKLATTQEEGVLY